VKQLKNKFKLSALAAVTATTILAGSAQADLLKRTFCIYDPIGQNGPLYNVMKSAKPAAMKWGIDLDLKALYR